MIGSIYNYNIYIIYLYLMRQIYDFIKKINNDKNAYRFVDTIYRYMRSTSGRRFFCLAAQTIWNGLPAPLCFFPCISTFCASP